MKFMIVIVTSLLLTGCAIGRGPMGEIVMGVDVGKMPETISEVGGSIASTFLGPQAGTNVSLILASVLGVGSVGAAAASGRSKEKSRKLADQGREKAEKEAVALRMLVQMLKNGKEAPSEPAA